MKGQGRTFNREIFEKKTDSLVFCCVSNINFLKSKLNLFMAKIFFNNIPRDLFLKDFSKFLISSCFEIDLGPRITY